MKSTIQESFQAAFIEEPSVQFSANLMNKIEQRKEIYAKKDRPVVLYLVLFCTLVLPIIVGAIASLTTIEFNSIEMYSSSFTIMNSLVELYEIYQTSVVFLLGFSGVYLLGKLFSNRIIRNKLVY